MRSIVVSSTFVATAALLLAAGCSSPGVDKPGTIFPTKPDCEIDSPVVPLGGDQQMVISFLEIGKAEDGFDLDGDGDPDNKLSAVGALARGAIEDSFQDFSIVIPVEVFSFPQRGADPCVKLAFYLGNYRFDLDGDGHETAGERGDCDDTDAAVHPGVAELADNGKDDNCDGNADETWAATDGGMTLVPSTSTADADMDGITVADGDCDDSNAAVTGGAEVCGDGLDNDCDGASDFGRDGAGALACTPYDETPDTLAFDPLSFEPGTMKPLIIFNSGEAVTGEAGDLRLHAGPSLFSVTVPASNDISLELRITGATIEGTLVAVGDGLGIKDGRLGGVLDAHTIDTVRGIAIDEVGLTAEDSLLDAVFANILGTIIGLQTDPMSGCKMPDIDVDRDGLEQFCDSNIEEDPLTVDKCIDGDGTIVLDEVDAAGVVTKHCTEAVDEDGAFRFVDGVSIEMNFDTTPAMLRQP